MQWSDFGPHVHPYVIGCPEPVMIHHVRLAAIEFCKKTLCWTKRLDTLQCTGTADVEVDPGGDLQIVKIKYAFVGDRPFEAVTPQYGITATQLQSQDEFVFTEDGKTIYINPIQLTGTPVLVSASLAPARTAKTLSNELDEYVEDIAHGAIASIMRLPAQTFTSNDHPIHETIFRERIKSIAAKVGIGMASVKQRRRRSFI